MFGNRMRAAAGEGALDCILKALRVDPLVLPDEDKVNQVLRAGSGPVALPGVWASFSASCRSSGTTSNSTGPSPTSASRPGRCAGSASHGSGAGTLTSTCSGSNGLPPTEPAEQISSVARAATDDAAAQQGFLAERAQIRLRGQSLQTPYTPLPRLHFERRWLSRHTVNLRPDTGRSQICLWLTRRP